MLLVSPATILADYIIDTLTSMSRPSDGGSWPLYVGSMPDGDDVESNCGAIYDTSGVKDGRLMIGITIQHYGVQLKIRSLDYNDGWEKIEGIADDLDDVNFDTVIIGVEEYEIQNVSRTSPVVSLGLEPGTKRRRLFTINFLLTIRNLTS